MAAAPSFTTGGVSGARSHDEDIWHVELAPGDVKVLSLERLDDLYRLEIIDESTRLWQPGMRGWTRLGIVAGIEPEPALVRQAPTRPTTSAMIPPPPSEWPPRGWSGSLPVGPPAPAPTMAPPARAKSRTPDSLRPLAIDDLPLVARKRGGGGGWLVLLAMLCGTGITLYRNDLLRQAAERYGQQRLYSRLEAAVGAPGFGTPRSIEQASPEVVAPTSGLPPPSPPAVARENASPPSAAQRVSVEPRGAQASARDPVPPSASSEAAKKAPTKSTKALAEVPAAQASSPGANPKARPKQAPTAKVEATSIPPEPKTPKAGAEPPKAGAEPLREAIRKSATRGQRRAPSSAEPPKDIGIKGSRHEYDPLNPKL